VSRKFRVDVRREKDVEAAGDRFMASLGFESWHLSQARPTQQTPGFPDRLYMNTARNCAVWWEAKTEVGRASVHQVRFRLQWEGCGGLYLIGTDEVLHQFAIDRGWAERVGPGNMRIFR